LITFSLIYGVCLNLVVLQKLTDKHGANICSLILNEYFFMYTTNCSGLQIGRICSHDSVADQNKTKQKSTASFKKWDLFKI